MKKKRVPGQGEGRAERPERYEAFCLEYIKDSNASRAARAAGYSKATAKEQGYHLLTNVHIKARIQKLIEERNKRLLLEGDEILFEIKKLATSDIRKLIDKETGCVLPVDEWPDEIATSVASFEVIERFHPLTGEHTGYVKKLKLWEKPKSQELLGKNKGLFIDKKEIQHKGNITVASKEQVAKEVDELDREY